MRRFANITLIQSRNPYQILNIQQGEDLKTAYRRAVMSNHPDKFMNANDKDIAEQNMKLINAAYNYLSQQSMTMPQYDDPPDPTYLTDEQKQMIVAKLEPFFNSAPFRALLTNVMVRGNRTQNGYWVYYQYAIAKHKSRYIEQQFDFVFKAAEAFKQELQKIFNDIMNTVVPQNWAYVKNAQHALDILAKACYYGSGSQDYLQQKLLHYALTVSHY